MVFIDSSFFYELLLSLLCLARWNLRSFANFGVQLNHVLVFSEVFLFVHLVYGVHAIVTHDTHYNLFPNFCLAGRKI